MLHMAGYVGQPEVPSLESVGQFFMIDSQLMENGSL